MRKIFALDGWYFMFFSKVANMMLLNLLFIVTSLPIITIGIGQVALIKALSDLQEDVTLSALKTYFMYFKKNIKKGIVLFGVETVTISLPFVLLYRLLSYLPILSVLLMVVYSFILLVIGVFPFIYSLENKSLKITGYDALKLVTMRIAYAIAIFVTPVVIGYLSLKTSFILLLFIGVSFSVSLQLFFYKKGMRSLE